MAASAAMGQDVPDPALRAGANINMAGGPVSVQTDDGTPTGNLAGLIEGDPFFTKQNELSFAVSSRNGRHILAGANDYRAVKIPLLETPPALGSASSGDVWGGVFVSLDQGRHWRSTLLPCYPQDTRPQCQDSPLFGFQAVADPQVRAGSHGLFYYCGIVFNRGNNAVGAVFCSRFMDLNNVEGVDFPLALPSPPDPSQPFASPIQHIDDNIIQSGTAGQFLDKISAAVDIVRSGAQSADISVPLNCDPTDNPACLAADGEDGSMDGFITQTIPCGTVYVAYADFTGGTKNPNSKLLVSRSLDCGQSWENATVVNQTQGVSQGAVVKVAPDGRVSVAWRQFGLDGELNSIWIARQEAGESNKLKFDPAVKVADLEAFEGSQPFDLPTRAADMTDSSGSPVEDPYVGFRTNTYPTLAIDAQGRHYLAWSQKGWGADVDGDGAISDGARIVITTSLDTINWTAPAPVDPQVPASGAGAAGAASADLALPRGHQIMPHLTAMEGRVAMVFYDFREDVFPDILRRLRSSQCDDPDEDLNGDGRSDFVDCCISEVGNAEGANAEITAADCERLDDPEFLESLIPVDPTHFAPLPVRHTVDVYVAEALPHESPVFALTKASKYARAIVPKRDAQGNLLPDEYDLVQLRYPAANYPLYGGDKAFMGDYIEINGADILAGPNGGWMQNLARPSCKSGVDCVPSPTAHVAFADSRDVVPPQPETVLDSEGREVLQQDWASEYLGIPGRARMLDQNPYTARLSGGVALGSPGNFKPLFLDAEQSRAFALILENTLNEGTLTGSSWTRGSRFYRLSFQAPAGIEVSFTPDFSSPTMDVEAESLTSIGVTLFARKGISNDLRPRITVFANEIEAIGAPGFKSGGLQASTVINPDRSNPLPVNVDLVDGASDILSEEIHTPQFIPFDCREFLDLTGPDGLPDNKVDDPSLLLIFPACTPQLGPDGVVTDWPQVIALATYWPELTDPGKPFALNASLFNASLFNASLFNPAIYSASLFNPALLDQSVYNWANASLFNASLFNASLFNASLFNASLFNASLFNPAIADSIRNASLFNASLFNASLFNASLFNASLFNASLFNASLFNASLFNASLLNASLFNASLFNASLFNNPVNGPVDGQQGVVGGIFPSEQIYNSAIFASPLKDGTKIVDLTWQIDTLANTSSGYFFFPLFQRLPDNAQLIIRRVSQSQTVALDPDCLATSPTPQDCPLKAFPIFDQEILANIIGLPDFRDLDPSVLNQILLQSTFTAPPGGRIFATLRATCVPDGSDPLICRDGYDPSKVIGVVVPQAEEDGLSGTWTVLESGGTVSAAFDEQVSFTAKVGSYNGSLPAGSVDFLVNGILIGSGPLTDVGGQAKAQISFTPGDLGLNAAGSPYSVQAKYVPDQGFRCGLGDAGGESGCFSQVVELIVTPVDISGDEIEVGVLLDVGTCDTGAFSDGVIRATFDGDPIEVCVRSALDEQGQPVLPPSVTFQLAYRDSDGNDLPGAPTDAGTYTVVITVEDRLGNYTGQLEFTLIIDKAALTLIFEDQSLTYPEPLAAVLNAQVLPPDGGAVVRYFLDSAEGQEVFPETVLDPSPTPYVIVAAASETDNYLSAQASALITVSFVEFAGFAPPVGPAGDFNDPDSVPFVGSFAVSKTLTLKWQLSQDGTEVNDLDLIHSITISEASPRVDGSCSFDANQTIPLYPSCASTEVCAGGTDLRSSSQYVFNWKLSSSESGTSVPTGCRTLVVNLGSAADGKVFASKAVILEIR
ncbi:MAG TPA: MBG domain-containing protein [Acidobacteriota bacterium]|nr:MBG domain-containing protein [Acidobacteriota bacterium]